MKIVVALLLCVCAIACASAPKPDPVLPTDTGSCAAACEHLASLGCEEGKPLEDGTSCEKFCVDTQNSGHGLNPSCVVGIESCEELEAVCHQG